MRSAKRDDNCPVRDSDEVLSSMAERSCIGASTNTARKVRCQTVLVVYWQQDYSEANDLPTPSITKPQ
jgi:hypothetical protein